MSEHTPFLTIFPGCASLAGSAGGLDKAYVTEVQVDSGEMTLSICAWFASMPSPVDIATISGRIRDDYGLSAVGIVPDYPRTVRASSPPSPQMLRRAARSRPAMCSWAGR